MKNKKIIISIITLIILIIVLIGVIVFGIAKGGNFSFLEKTSTLYDEEFYDNENIIFEISEDGYSFGDIINPKETQEIYITFKYKKIS